MPTLPLFDQNPLADASHNVRAPGGYEWWYFDAEDPTTDTQIVAIFLQGFIFHPKYLRQYFRYRRRPTKHAPPLPADFPCAYFVLYQQGRIVSQFMTQYQPAAYTARRDEVNVEIGPNTLTRNGNALRLHMEGSPWSVTWQGPKTDVRQRLVADLSFTPVLDVAPAERPFLSRAMTGAEHHWVIANPLCHVSGTIARESGDSPTLNFTGRGYHDHNYGTGPIGPGLAWWFWGRAIVDERVITFHYAVPKDKRQSVESHAIMATPSGISELPVVPVVGRSYRTTLGLAYPEDAQWGDLMTLTQPRVIDSAPFYLRLQYTARIGDQSTTAFCEIAYPHRLRWPILGRMIEMSIDKRDV